MKYQSGRGSAFRLVGSATGPRSGGPSQVAAASTIAPTPTAKTTSFQAASGQNGTPTFSNIAWYRSRYVLGSTRSPGFGGAEIPWYTTSTRCSPITTNIAA